MLVMLLGIAVVLALTFGLILMLARGFQRDSCIPLAETALEVCAVSDMAKLPNHGEVPLEGVGLDLRRGPLRLDAARNETVGFQLILKNLAKTSARVQVTLDDLAGDNGARIEAKTHTERFLAHYVRVDPGGYTWGPRSEVLPWPEFYPDALIPFESRCGEPQTLIESFEVSSGQGANQAVWLDIYVPKNLPPGDYRGQVHLQADRATLDIPVNLQVWEATLPDRPSLDAVGELYRAYEQEGAGQEIGSDAWRRMAHCYQRLAHRHRMVFIERTDRILGPVSDADAGQPQAWEDYDRVYGAILTGELFTAKHGYTGPGENTPVNVWRTPWPQTINRRIERPLADGEIQQYATLARHWAQHSSARGWNRTRYFAYVFDEVDGPTDTDANVDQAAASEQRYLKMAHGEMRRLQQALDAGAGSHRIDLLWTSHTNPAVWEGKTDIDLSGTIRLWCPNARAADPAFLRKRARQGERSWFYHAGHPAIGVHAINASGIEMRTWGLAAARYGLQGQLMWALNYGDPEDPYRYPSYRRQDDRFGNGVLVYPGALLPRIGRKASPGPIPSMRLKAWRTGLQEADLVQLARAKGRGEEVDRLLTRYIPEALAEAKGKAAWSSNPADWYDFHRELLELTSDR
jgi:hypothetical protein